MTSTQTLRDLLHMIAQRRAGASWRINCAYFDGFGDPIYEISIHYPSEAGKVNKRLVFRWNSGELVPNGCHLNHSGDPTHIEDALLDLLNEAGQPARQS